MKVVVIVCLFLLGLLSCTKKKNSIQGDFKSYPDLESYNVNMRYSDSAQLQMTVEADKQIRLKNQDELFEKGVFVSFYNGEDTIQSTMKCDSAYFINEESLWKAWGNVVVHNITEKRTLESEYLEWKPEAHTVYTNEHVEITSPEQKIVGKGLKAKEDFSEYEILNITGIISMEE